MLDRSGQGLSRIRNRGERNGPLRCDRGKRTALSAADGDRDQGEVSGIPPRQAGPIGSGTEGRHQPAKDRGPPGPPGDAPCRAGRPGPGLPAERRDPIAPKRPKADPKQAAGEAVPGNLGHEHDGGPDGSGGSDTGRAGPCAAAPDEATGRPSEGSLCHGSTERAGDHRRGEGPGGPQREVQAEEGITGFAAPRGAAGRKDRFLPGPVFPEGRHSPTRERPGHSAQDGPMAR